MAIKTEMSIKKNLNLRKRFKKEPSKNFKQINTSIEFDKSFNPFLTKFTSSFLRPLGQIEFSWSKRRTTTPPI